MLLAGDIGGTKTNLALFSSKEELRTPILEDKFPSAHYPSLEALVQEFLSRNHVSVQAAVFGVAGPIIENQAKITNLPWVIDICQLQKTLEIPTVHLLNDLNAMAHALPLLEAPDLHTLNVGEAVTHGTLAVVAPGTGLGEAFVTWDGSRYHPYPSEGGHADFAPTNMVETELLRHLLGRFNHVSYEMVCSGIGLPHIYSALKETGFFEEPAWLSEQLAGVDDATPIIVDAALNRNEAPQLCVATLNIFSSILGAEAGNMALKVLATGGVYIGGGIPPRILPFLDDERFLRSFKNKGRLSDMLSRIPVQVILNPNVALLGAAAYGFSL